MSGFICTMLGASTGGGGVADSYFILYRTTDITTQDFTIQIHSDKSIYLSTMSTALVRILKIAEDGTITWQKRLSNINYTANAIENMVVDSSGNSIFCFNDGSTAQAMYLARYNSSDGALQYSTKRTLGGSDSLDVRLCLQDSSGNSYIIGQLNGRMAIWKFNSDGTFNTYKAYTWNGVTNATSLSATFDSSNNLFIYISFGGFDQQIWKFDTSLNVTWSYEPTHASGPGAIRSIKTDSSGNVYLFSTSRSTILKINSSGSLVWEKLLSVTVSNSANGSALDIDSSGNVYVIYRNTNEYIVKLDSNGNVSWSRTLTVNGATGNGPKIRVSGNNLYIYGTGRNAAASNVSYIMKVPTDGTKTGTYDSGTLNFVYSTASVTVSSPGAFSMQSRTSQTYTLATSSASETLTFSASSYGAYTKVNVV